MNIKKIFSNANTKASFLAGVIVSFFVFLLFNATTGITGEKLRGWVKKPDYNSGNADSDYPKADVKNLQLMVKYISGGDIVVLDEKGEVIARSTNDPIKQGPLTELRNISFLTVVENGYDTDGRDHQKMGFIDSIIPTANAATTTYEYHYIKVDNQIVACRKHRKSPLPHVYVGNC